MKIIQTHETDLESLPEFEREQVYNGLDVCVTQDVFQALQPQLDNCTEATYNFSKALQGPVLEMAYRGVLVDKSRRDEVIAEFVDQIDILEDQLNRIVLDGVGMAYFNWRSYKDLQDLFYNRLGLPHQYKQGRPTTDRGAREKLEVYPIAEQICKHINLIAELGDKISVLKTGIDNDGRIRTSYNIAGTSTGRFSSSASEFDTGGNLQNVEESLRSIFIADLGMKFAKLDAKSGESFCVGAIEWNLFDDGRYLDACATGDPHTAVARIMWPELPWTGDLKRDKAIAEQPYYRHYTYRFMCKKLGHGSNYLGQPQTLSAQAKVPVDVVEAFQPKYFEAFPHQRWHAWVQEQLIRKGYLISLCGRKRYFFKRRSEPKTLREALAFDPQSSLADIVNSAMLRLWKMNTAIIMMQDHDALTFMYPEAAEDKVIGEILKHIVTPIELKHGRTLRIPYDVEIGWNKAHASDSNPDGLQSWNGHDDRKRSPPISLLDKVICR